MKNLNQFLLLFFTGLLISCGAKKETTDRPKAKPLNNLVEEEVFVESGFVLKELPEGAVLFSTHAKKDETDYKLIVKRAVSFDEEDASIEHFQKFKDHLNQFIIALDTSDDREQLRLNCEGHSDGPASSEERFLGLNLEGDTSSKVRLNCFVDILQGDELVVQFDPFEIKKDLLIDPSLKTDFSAFGIPVSPAKAEYGVILVDTSNDKELGTLFTYGKNYNISTDQLISRKKMVLNSYPEKVAPHNQSGKNGGSLTLNAKYAYGDFDIQLDGQDAGQMNVTVPPRNYAGVTCVKKRDTGKEFDHFHDVKGIIPAVMPFNGKKGGDSGKIFISIQKRGLKFNFFSNTRSGSGSFGKDGTRSLKYQARAIHKKFMGVWDMNNVTYHRYTLDHSHVFTVTKVNPECHFLVRSWASRDRLRFMCLHSNCVSANHADKTNMTGHRGKDGHKFDSFKMIDGVIHNF